MPTVPAKDALKDLVKTTNQAAQPGQGAPNVKVEGLTPTTIKQQATKQASNKVPG